MAGCLDDLRKSIQQLSKLGEYPFPAQLDHLLAILDPGAQPPPDDLYIPPFGTQRQATADLDMAIRQALRTQAPPEIWVDLNETRLIFFGVPFSVDRHLEGTTDSSPGKRLSRPEAALLWVLAERPGEVVHRKTIRKEGKIAPAHDRQSEYISRMRRKLKKAVVAYFTAKGRELSEEARMCFILSVEGGGKSGPYKLALDKSRVRLPHDRPNWMKARTD